MLFNKSIRNYNNYNTKSTIKQQKRLFNKPNFIYACLVSVKNSPCRSAGGVVIPIKLKN